MKQINLNLKWIPDFYFILVSILWYYLSVQSSETDSSRFVNFPAVIMIVVFHIQLFLNDQVLGKILAGISVFATLYIMYILATEIYDMHLTGESDYLYILKAGNLILVNFIMAYLMYSKYNFQEQLNPGFNQLGRND